MNLLYDQKPNAELDFPRGLKVIRAYDDVTLSFENNDEKQEYKHTLDVGETIRLPDGSLLSAEWSDRCNDEGTHVFICDTHHVTPPLSVRTRRKGDRMRIRGMNGSKKVKDIFIDQKIPARLRDSWPLVVDSTGEILWLIGLKKGGECTCMPSGTWLRLQYENKVDT